MTLRSFLRERLAVLLVAGVSCALAIALAGSAGVPWSVVVAAVSLLAGGTAAATWREYVTQRRFYGRLRAHLRLLERKCDIIDLVEPPVFASGKATYEALAVVAESVTTEIDAYRRAEQNYQSFVEAWIHEIKTPLTTLKLIAANTPDAGDALTREIDRVADFAEQALFFARSSAVEHDYRIRPLLLADVTDRVLRQLAAPLVAVRCTITRHGLDTTVLSDPKWLDFVVKQIIVNAAQYKSDRPLVVAVSATSDWSSTTLRIADNGVGIPAVDLTRVGRRGFVGDNGRRRSDSSGLGLFLCRRLCEQMNIRFTLESVPSKGTIVSLTFAHDAGVLISE